MIKDLTQQLSRGDSLTIDQRTSVINEILGGTQNDQDVADFLKNLQYLDHSVYRLVSHSWHWTCHEAKDHFHLKPEKLNL